MELSHYSLPRITKSYWSKENSTYSRIILWQGRKGEEIKIRPTEKRVVHSCWGLCVQERFCWRIWSCNWRLLTIYSSLLPSSKACPKFVLFSSLAAICSWVLSGFGEQRKGQIRNPQIDYHETWWGFADVSLRIFYSFQVRLASWGFWYLGKSWVGNRSWFLLKMSRCVLALVRSQRWVWFVERSRILGSAFL